MVRLWVLGFVLAGASSCIRQPQVVISPVLNPVPLRQGQPFIAEHDGFFVTQGWMAMAIEGTK